MAYKMGKYFVNSGKTQSYKNETASLVGFIFYYLCWNMGSKSEGYTSDSTICTNGQMQQWLLLYSVLSSSVTRDGQEGHLPQAPSQQGHRNHPPSCRVHAPATYTCWELHNSPWLLLLQEQQMSQTECVCREQQHGEDCLGLPRVPPPTLTLGNRAICSSSPNPCNSPPTLPKGFPGHQLCLLCHWFLVRLKSLSIKGKSRIKMAYLTKFSSLHSDKQKKTSSTDRILKKFRNKPLTGPYTRNGFLFYNLAISGAAQGISATVHHLFEISNSCSISLRNLKSLF